MIPFFRKIRKKMADDNKPLKYMRYAIGEIVLVVVGILIALQINNWNETNKLRKMEISLLENLVEELKGDLESFDGMKSWSQDGAEASAYVADALHKKTPINDSLIMYFYSITLPFWFNYQNATFENLKSEGFGIISNNDIRNRIQNLYSNEYIGISKLTDMFNQEFLLNMNVQQTEHLDVINGNYPVDYIGLQNNFIFINTLRDNGRNHEFHADNMSKLIVLLKDLIDAIEQELSDK